MGGGVDGVDGGEAGAGRGRKVVSVCLLPACMMLDDCLVPSTHCRWAVIGRRRLLYWVLMITTGHLGQVVPKVPLWYPSPAATGTPGPITAWRWGHWSPVSADAPFSVARPQRSAVLVESTRAAQSTTTDTTRHDETDGKSNDKVHRRRKKGPAASENAAESTASATSATPSYPAADTASPVCASVRTAPVPVPVPIFVLYEYLY